jgi:hypothetical protein
MIPEMIVRHRLSSVAELRLGNHPLSIAVTRPETDDFALEPQFLAEVIDVAGDDREAEPRGTDIHTAEESEFLSDPIVALSVRIVIATLSS